MEKAPYFLVSHYSKTARVLSFDLHLGNGLVVDWIWESAFGENDFCYRGRAGPGGGEWWQENKIDRVSLESGVDFFLRAKLCHINPHFYGYNFESE